MASQQQQQQGAADDWEQEADNEQYLAQQTSRMNINVQAPSFRPQASSFVPGGQAYYPQQQYYQQQGYPQQQMYGAQNAYPQYQQPQYGYQQQQGGYGGGYGAPQQQTYQPQLLQRGQNPTYQTKKESEAPKTSGLPSLPPPRAPISGTPSTTSIPGKTSAPTGPAKVLKIGSTAEPAKENKPVVKKEKEEKKEPAPAKVAAPATEESTATEPKETKKPASNTPSKPPSTQGSRAPSVNGDEPAPTAESRDADAVVKEQEEELDETLVQDMYGKEHVNVVFIGHVDAGKSTLGGNILFLTGMVDERTMEKYEKEAKEAGRESWYLSWALDSTKEERSKGKTVEVGRARFETERRRYTILDAPGHKSYVPNMISGAAQADVGVLVISARKGEYETGFDKGGQTREHAVLAKMQGINKLVIVINKMDDPTVEWSKDRYEECTKRLAVFLKGNGFNPKTDLFFIPISAYKGYNLKDRVDKKICPWWDGPSLLEYLDSMQSLERKVKAALMMPIGGKFKDMGTVIEGKIESGSIRKGTTQLIMPNKTQVEVMGVYTEADEEMPVATSGDQVRLRLKGVEEEDLSVGFVLSSPKAPVHVVSVFEAQVAIIELKTLLSAGYTCVMHVHTAVEEVTFDALLHKLNKQNQRSKKPPAFAIKGQKIVARLRTNTPLCLEKFEDYPMLGRFTLRDQATTVAIGKITKLILD